MVPKLIAFILLVSATCIMQGQSPADWWYFGNEAGIHFTSSGPVVDTNSAMYALEGCATISKNNGDLLFYTNGTEVYDATHNQMPNGSGLLGTASSTHSAVILPKPQNSNIYYIFTVDATENSGLNGLRYTIVDMTLNSGLGDVDLDTYNIQLFDSTSEKIAVYPHANNNDYWVLSHRLHEGQYRANKVTATGVHTTPVLSSIGSTLTVGSSTGNVPRGSMRFSPKGDKLASANMGVGQVEVMDFNRTTGELSNLVTLNFGTSLVYGLEFSPNGQFLYVSSWSTCYVSQFDVSLGNEALIQASLDTVNNYSQGAGGALQMGLDGKLYAVSIFNQYLDVIHSPDLPGTACNYQDSAIYLLGRLSLYGLPTFVQTFLAQPSAEGFCLFDSTQFSADTNNVDSVLWEFGDPSTGSLNFSTDVSPFHIYSDTGVHLVTLIAYSDTLIDTVTTSIYIYPRQSIDLGPDLTMCDGDTAIFAATQLFASYLWQDGSNDDSMVVASDSIIWVRVDGVCDTVSDTVMVRFDFPILFDFGPDTSLCGNLPIVLDANLQVRTDTFFWNTPDTIDSIAPAISGLYRFEATNVCGTTVDSLMITFLPVPQNTILPPDTVNCFDNEIILVHANLAGANYVWSDSTTKITYTLDTTETVWLAWYNECGFAIDTFTAIFNGEIKVDIGEDTTICEGDSIRLTATWPGSTYAWNTGDTTDTLWTLQEDKLYVVTITYNLCSTIESRRVDQDLFFCPTINCALRYANVITPNGDGLNDRFRAESDCDIYRYEMRIYNRWGQQVHHSTNISYGWDGFIEGAPAADGVYYFMINFKDNVVIDEDQNVYKGNFELIRE